MTKKIVIYISQALLILLLLLGCGVASYKIWQKFSINAPVKVKVAPIDVRQQPNSVTVPGTLQPLQRILLTSAVTGYIKTRLFRNGQQVKHGDLLLELDDTTAKTHALAAQATYNSAQIRFDQAQRQFKHNHAKEQRLANLRAALKTALANKLQATNALSYYKIYAPFTGVLGNSNFYGGDLLIAGRKITPLMDNGMLKVVYSLPEKYLTQLHDGQPVFITVPTATDKIFASKVNFIAPLVDNNTHSVAIEALLPNHDAKLIPGVTVTVKQHLPGFKIIKLLPQASLITKPQGDFVYKVMRGRAYLTKVNIKRANGYLIINDGLTIRDLVVVDHNKLLDGQRILAVR